MDYNQKIEALESEKAELKVQLANLVRAEEGSDKQKRLHEEKHDIRQQIIAIDNQITALIQCSSRPSNVMMNEDLERAMKKNLWDCISRTASSRCPNFKENLSVEWESEGFYCCPILKALYTPAELQQIKWTKMITAAHIIPHSCKREAVTAAMNFDVDAVQNGMLICKTFQMAFDAQEWYFVPSLDAKSPFQIMLCDLTFVSLVSTSGSGETQLGKHR